MNLLINLFIVTWIERNWSKLQTTGSSFEHFIIHLRLYFSDNVPSENSYMPWGTRTMPTLQLFLFCFLFVQSACTIIPRKSKSCKAFLGQTYVVQEPVQMFWLRNARFLILIHMLPCHPSTPIITSFIHTINRKSVFNIWFERTLYISYPPLMKLISLNPTNSVANFRDISKYRDSSGNILIHNNIMPF